MNHRDNKIQLMKLHFQFTSEPTANMLISNLPEIIFHLVLKTILLLKTEPYICYDPRFQ